MEASGTVFVTSKKNHVFNATSCIWGGEGVEWLVSEKRVCMRGLVSKIECKFYEHEKNILFVSLYLFITVHRESGCLCIWLARNGTLVHCL